MEGQEMSKIGVTQNGQITVTVWRQKGNESLVGFRNYGVKHGNIAQKLFGTAGQNGSINQCL